MAEPSHAELVLSCIIFNLSIGTDMLKHRSARRIQVVWAACAIRVASFGLGAVGLAADSVGTEIALLHQSSVNGSNPVP